MEPIEENRTEKNPVDPIEEIQAEDSPVLEEPKSEEVKATTQDQPVKKSFWSKVLTWVIVALIFFIGGVATLFFTLYQPARDAAKAANEKVSLLSEDLDTAKGQTTLVQAELDSVRAELTSANTTIQEKTAELAKANQLKTVYKFIADVNAARAVLETLDINSSRQAINFAKADLVELEATGLDPDAIAGFSARLEEADSNLNEPDLLKSREALNTLYSNLLLLVNNLP